MCLLFWVVIDWCCFYCKRPLHGPTVNAIGTVSRIAICLVLHFVHDYTSVFIKRAPEYPKVLFVYYTPRSHPTSFCVLCGVSNFFHPTTECVLDMHIFCADSAAILVSQVLEGEALVGLMGETTNGPWIVWLCSLIKQKRRRQDFRTFDSLIVLSNQNNMRRRQVFFDWRRMSNLLCCCNL